MTRTEARAFLMKHTSYVNFELPPYIDFSSLLTLSSAFIGHQSINNLCKVDGRSRLSPKNYDAVNYTVLSNKDGAYSWRPLQIIHPIMYVELVNLLTSETNWSKLLAKFDEYSNSYVECISLPRQSLDEESDKAWTITNWWESIEQETIKQALGFNFLAVTDITDCYGSIYTHTFEWALDEGGKVGAKERKRSRARTTQDHLGAQIDFRLMNMNSGQTNGIPQGSVIMDLLAEIILGYADQELTKRIKDNLKISKSKFKILRYRDDYRILTDNSSTAGKILKELDKVLSELNFKMSPSKTSTSTDIIGSAVKKEKLDTILLSPAQQSFQKRALRIYQLSQNYPNSGLVARELSEFYDKFSRYKKKNVNTDVLIAIFVMVGVNSPRYMHLVSSIISRIFEKIEDVTEIKKIMKQIISKYGSIPNSGLIDIWLQRISEPLKLNNDYNERFTRVVIKQEDLSSLWNNEWLDDEAVMYLDSSNVSLLPERIAQKTITYVIERPEFELYRFADY